MKGMKHICVDFIQGACTKSLVSQVQGATTHPPHPWSLWLVNHFPQALLVVLWLWVTALIWLAKPSGKIPWLGTAFWHQTLIKICPPYPLVFTQNNSATHPRIGLGLGSPLTPSKTASPLVFFPAIMAWTQEMPVFKQKLSGHLLAKSHRYRWSEMQKYKFLNEDMIVAPVKFIFLQFRSSLCFIFPSMG